MNYNFKNNITYMPYFDITTEPVNNVYEELLALLFDTSDSFILVEREDVVKKNEFYNCFNLLYEFQYDIKYQNVFAGTEIMEDTQKAKVYYYRSDKKAKNILLNLSNKLYSWVQPELPEDLSFIFKDSYTLVTTSHEQTSGIYINEMITIEKINSIVGLKGELTMATMCYNK